jgi:bifunctional non-homologous end joining protein LigD
MHATSVARPFHHDGWVYEENVDGYRMVVVKANGVVQLISRNGRDHTKRFAQLADALGGLNAKTLIPDGEVAIFDRELVSRFEWLRSRPKDEPSTTSVYIAFDVLEIDGRDLRPKPLRERRRVLDRLVKVKQKDSRVRERGLYDPEKVQPRGQAPCLVERQED